MVKARVAFVFSGICGTTLIGTGACSDDGSSGSGPGGAAGEEAGGAAGQPSTGGTGGTVQSGGAAGEVASGGAAGEVASGGAAGNEATAGATGEGGAGGDGASGAGGVGEGECADGCTCEADEMCDYGCAADCEVECLSSRCTAECPDGGCTLDADLGAVAAFGCDGGGCATDCDGESDCTVSCEGGGCEVGCDGESSCTVLCAEDGDACVVTCEAGSVASCSGNCELVNCEPCDPTHNPDYMPEINPDDFSTTIDNPLMPWPMGATWTYEGEGEVTTITVEEETKTVMGVECVVVHDSVSTPEGELIEDTHDWYAQDSEGNVWYFGEDTVEYVNGQVANRYGAWEAGVDGALPGIAMQASPEVGMVYYQEFLACEAEDQGEVVAVGESVTVPAGSWDDCVRTRDFTELDPRGSEFKTYCPGIGVVLESDAETDERLQELTDYDLP